MVADLSSGPVGGESTSRASVLRSVDAVPPYNPAVPRISSAVAQAARVVGLSVDDGSENTMDSAAHPIDMGCEILDHIAAVDEPLHIRCRSAADDSQRATSS